MTAAGELGGSLNICGFCQFAEFFECRKEIGLLECFNFRVLFRELFFQLSLNSGPLFLCLSGGLLVLRRSAAEVTASAFLRLKADKRGGYSGKKDKCRQFFH